MAVNGVMTGNLLWQILPKGITQMFTAIDTVVPTLVPSEFIKSSPISSTDVVLVTAWAESISLL